MDHRAFDLGRGGFFLAVAVGLLVVGERVHPRFGTTDAQVALVFVVAYLLWFLTERYLRPPEPGGTAGPVAEGHPGAGRTLVWLGVGWYLELILGAADRMLVDWAVVWRAPFWNLAFAGVFLAGGALRIRAMVYLGRHFSHTLMVRPGQELVTTGPFARVRHPSYTGLLLLVGAQPFITGSLFSLGFAVANAVFLWVRVHDEEAMLERAFGAAYRAYRARTAAVIPGLW